MAERTTMTVTADTLPPELVARMRPRPLPSAKVRVTLGIEEPTPQEWLDSARAGIDRGRADIAAGRVLDGETALRKLYAKHCGDK